MYGGYLKERLRLGGSLVALVLLVAVVRCVWPGAAAVPTFVRMADQVLVIDPGHGGEDGGAVSAAGQRESEVNLAIARQLDALMGLYGAPSVLPRTEDVSIHDPSAKSLREKKVSDIHNRVALVQDLPNATLISIHQNAYPSAQYHGLQVFYGSEALSLPLARAIQDEVRAQLDPTNERVPQAVASSVYLMAHVSCRAVLVECGFLSNPEEAARLGERSQQMKLAMILAASYLRCGDIEEGESLI